MSRRLVSLCVLMMSVAAPAAARTTVPLFTNISYPGGWGPGMTTTVTLPDAQTMHGFNSMQVSMDMACPTAGCPPWDFLANLYVCPGVAGANANATTCNQEIARWITPYGKAGNWTTDITPMLGLLQSGGNQTFYFWTPQAYTLNVSLVMDSNGPTSAPTRAIALFQGGTLDANYNPAHVPVTVTFDNKPLKAQIFTLVTGHGWGADTDDCAEFCNIAHHFGAGGKDYSVDFPQGGSATGCQDLVAQGVVPNQYGTWQYGRDGWCPGWDVHPVVFDVTQSLHAGHNVVTYQALHNGVPYVPTPVASPAANAFAANIALSSYLVVWDAPAPSPTPSPTVSAVPTPLAATPTASAPAPAPGDPAIAQAAPGAFSFDQTRSGCTAVGPQLFAWVLPALLLRKRRAR